jgi:cytochrome c oxidase subunit 2
MLASFWLPDPASSVSPEHDWLWYFLYYVSVFFFILIITLMVIFAIRYRRRRPDQVAESQVSHSTAMELAWTLPPVILVIIIFAMGLSAFLQISTDSANALEIKVRAYRWNWEFEYPLPDGGVYRDRELHVPIDRPVRLVMSSSDVIHSLFVPAFRVKKDAVPGRYNKVWFRPTKAGTFPLYCAEYCGTQHSQMLSTVTVHEPGRYQVWLAEASKAPIEDLPPELYEQWKGVSTPEQMDAFVEQVRQETPDLVEVVEALEPPAITGERLYRKSACFQCHSIDGTRMTGPTFQGLWQKTRVFTDGTQAVADENYIRESILNPQEKVVESYAGIMNSYQGRLSDRQIDALIAYIRSLEQPPATP